ncbi:MAG: tRNA (adenosine(37)-N6)-dimethylallyltransferase MiaA [Pseudomonadota bacterium]|nr:tRNA (adenosine(37)-N6)-dimethylallyltransferase MiaA [Pseudomonadota bacterium]
MEAKSAILIAGPTASGKSAIALSVARRIGGVVINADSMQVYRELPVLTAQPEAEDLAGASHDLYGFVPACEAYSVGQWIGDMEGALNRARAAKLVPVVTGGTGLYFKALLEGLSPVPDIPEEVRKHWRVRAGTLAPSELHGELAARDPVMAERLRPSDPQRVVRALEVVEATGVSLAKWHEQPGTPLISPASARLIVVSPPRELLRQRIDTRFAEMVEKGGLAEAERAMAMHLDATLPAMRALGLRPLLASLRGEIPLETAISQAQAETRQYAKRQSTWLKGNMISWKWFHEKDSERLRADILSFIDA